MRLRHIALGFVVLLLDCASLDKLPQDTCGNGVIDQHEDCDTFPNDPSDTTRARCGAPTDGETACRLRCGLQTNGDTLVCPDGWGCSVDHICREPTGKFDNVALSSRGWHGRSQPPHGVATARAREIELDLGQCQS